MVATTSAQRVTAVAALVVLFFACYVAGSTMAPITNLPGWNNEPALSMYSGYVTVSESHERNLFYWLVESLNEPSTDPLVVWFQGGPGCSGLAGLLTENGPFTVTDNLTLAFNPYTWANLANVLYLEQPAGVGFSYSEDPADYKTNDTRAANDNYAFLQGFLEMFPQYQGRDLWITGESYGGIYVPDLAREIILGPDADLLAQFKGFMIGNPVNNCPAFDDIKVQFNIYYWHGLVSQTKYAKWIEHHCDIASDQEICKRTFNEAQNQIGVIYQQLKDDDSAFDDVAAPKKPSLDPDDLYQDFCLGNGTLEFAVETNETVCFSVGDRVQDYLNQASVQAAIGANATHWAECTRRIHYDIIPELLNMNPNFELAFKQGLNVLVYSGDVDVATVPMWGTSQCLNSLNRTLVDDWKPWFVNDATAGYVQKFDTYTYATIKGAGHEAPQYQPLTAYNMFSRFLLTGSLLNSAEEEKAAAASRRRVSRVLKQSDMLRQYGLVTY